MTAAPDPPTGPSMQRVEDMRPFELTVVCGVTIASAVLTLVVRWHALALFTILPGPFYFYARYFTIAGGVVAALLLVGAVAAFFRLGGPIFQLAWWLSALDSLLWTGLAVALVVMMVDALPHGGDGGVGALAIPIGAVAFLRAAWSAFKLGLGVWAIMTLRSADVRAWLGRRSLST